MLARVTLLVLLATACAAPARFTPTDRTAITAMIQAQAEAWNRGDLDGFMAGYAKVPTLVFTSGAKIRRGWQAAHDHFHKRYGTDKSTMGKLAFEILSIDSVGADGAVVLGSWRLTETPQAGAGIFSVVVHRRPEGWRVIHDHTSSQ